jgi:hypothetical protein
LTHSAQRPDVDHWTADPDFRGAVHIQEFDRPEGDQSLTRQAIALMHALANRDQHHPRIHAAALQIARQLPDHPRPQRIADTVFYFVKRAMRYQHEDEMHTPFNDFADFLYDQTLIEPAAILSMPDPRGDCVDFSMLCSALLQVFHIPAAYRTIAANPASPDYSHVYVVAQLAPGRFYALDTSNGPAPGMEFALPKGKRKATWPNPADLRRPAEMIRTRARLGATDDEGNWIPDPAPAPDQIAPGTYAGGYTDQYAPLAPTPTPPAASGGWTKLLTTLTNDASAIAAPLIRQSTIQAPYYITGANGQQILYDPSTGKVANATAASSALGGASGSLLMLIGGALLLFAMTEK